MTTWIDLPYGGPGARFDAEELKIHIERDGMGYIIQGQQACVLKDHTKPRSLDVWLRKRCGKPDTKQAVNRVIEQLVRTGMFYEDKSAAQIAAIAPRGSPSQSTRTSAGAPSISARSASSPSRSLARRGRIRFACVVNGRLRQADESAPRRALRVSDPVSDSLSRKRRARGPEGGVPLTAPAF